MRARWAQKGSSGGGLLGGPGGSGKGWGATPTGFSSATASQRAWTLIGALLLLLVCYTFFVVLADTFLAGSPSPSPSSSSKSPPELSDESEERGGDEGEEEEVSGEEDEDEEDEPEEDSGKAAPPTKQIQKDREREQRAKKQRQQLLPLQLLGRSKAELPPKVKWSEIINDAKTYYEPPRFLSRRRHEYRYDETIQQRQQAVKNEFLHAWWGYCNYTWGLDELKPISKQPHHNFRLGLTIIDSLDTMFIMGLKDEFKKGRDWVANEMVFRNDAVISLFETTIRILGGLLSAHHLSGDEVFLSRAQEFGKLLLLCFNTPNGIPYPSINLKDRSISQPPWAIGISALSEISSLQLEFSYLAKMTGDMDFARKPIAVLDMLYSLPKFETGLFPITVQTTRNDWGHDKRVTLGALGDSFYEYVLKLWLLTGATKYRDSYDTFLKGILDYMVIDAGGYTFITELSSPHLPPSRINKMDHLVCFMGGLIALGAVSSPEEDNSVIDHQLQIAHNVTATCKYMYDINPTKLAPEIFHTDPSTHKPIVNPSARHNLLRPETVESLFILYRITGDPIYQEWGWEIFEGFRRTSRVEHGYSGIRDVTTANVVYDDTQQSFFMAETLKYLYLLFSPPDLIPLDRYVFNTEAHPLPLIL